MMCGRSQRALAAAVAARNGDRSDGHGGVPPLNPGRSYVIAHAGDGERRAFEVRDFTVGPERTSVFIICRDHDTQPKP
jgi:hypothetical protein